MRLSIGNDGTTATVYNVGKITEDALPSANIIAVVGSKPLRSASSDISIAQNSEKSSDVGGFSLEKVGGDANQQTSGDIGSDTPKKKSKTKTEIQKENVQLINIFGNIARFKK